MTHTISVDDATFATLKRLANKSGRTIVGQLRWLLGEQDATFRATRSYATNISDDESSEFKQLFNKLQYLDEDSPEYEETLSKISKLQKKA